jgi:hypothetical protein
MTMQNHPMNMKRVLPCTGAGVEQEQEDEAMTEDEAMAEAEQVEQLRGSGHMY